MAEEHRDPHTQGVGIGVHEATASLTLCDGPQELEPRTASLLSVEPTLDCLRWQLDYLLHTYGHLIRVGGTSYTSLLKHRGHNTVRRNNSLSVHLILLTLPCAHTHNPPILKYNIADRHPSYQNCPRLLGFLSKPWVKLGPKRRESPTRFLTELIIPEGHGETRFLIQDHESVVNHSTLQRRRLPKLRHKLLKRPLVNHTAKNVLGSGILAPLNHAHIHTLAPWLGPRPNPPVQLQPPQHRTYRYPSILSSNRFEQTQK